jgi:hypothetical protein
MQKLKHMISIKREFIRFEDRLVEVVRACPIHRIKSVEGLKETLKCDTVLKLHETMYFCTSVQEAELIE